MPLKHENTEQNKPFCAFEILWLLLLFSKTY